jgi:hypothetical protein
MCNSEKILSIEIEALVVSENNNSREFADLTPHFDKISEGIVLGDMIAGDQVFKTTELEKGVHLHWKLPDCLMHGIKKGENDNLEYPVVPNRWLVIRLLKQSKNFCVSKSWVVESDYIFDKEWPGSITNISIPIRESSDMPLWFKYVGRNMVIGSMKENSKMKPAVYLDKLTAIGPGDPFFAAYYPNCRSVFGLYDDLSGLEKEIDELSIDLSYLVFGWYSDPKQAEQCELLYGMTSEMGVSREWNGNIIVATGNTSIEALSPILESKMPDNKDERGSKSRLLDAYQYHHLSRMDSSPDGIAEIELSNYQKTFTPVSGGIEWIITEESSTSNKNSETILNSSKPFPKQIGIILAKINVLQKTCDRYRRYLASEQWELYSAWYKYIQARDTPFSSHEEINNVLKYIGFLKGRIGKYKKNIGKIEDKLGKKFKYLNPCLKDYPSYKLDNIASPNFWQANEPIFLLHAPKSSFELKDRDSSKNGMCLAGQFCS